MSTNPRTAAEYFGAMVESYDSLIGRAVPRYDEMMTRLIEHIPRQPEPTRVLELGCGTGSLTLRLVEAFPRALVTTVDAAPEMTRIAADRAGAAGHGERVATVTARFEDVRFEPGSFDLVTSCMSLHHVRDKGPLYARVREWLVPGGWLCFADQVLGGSPESQHVHWEAWLEFCRRPGHCTEDELRGLLDHAAAHDHYEPLSDHFMMLREAGFGMLDCAWRSGMYTVVMARAGPDRAGV